MLRRVPLIFVVMLAAPAMLWAQTVDDVIAKNVQAVGGMDKLKGVDTLRESGKFQIDGFQAEVVQLNKRPNRVRQEFIIQGMAQVQAYDGKGGWQVNPFSGRRDAELMSDDDSKDLQVAADIDGPLVDYKDKGHKAELVGHDSVEGTDCYKVKLTLKNGDVRYYYIDTDSYMLLKVETQTTVRGTIQENETYFGDYEKVNGIYYPFAMESGQKGDPNRTKITVEKIEQNVPIDDSKFVVPAKPATKPAGGT